MQLNPTFINNVRDIYGATGIAWIDELPHLLADLASKWNFEFLYPMPELTFNFVGAVKLQKPRTSGHATAVLKLSPPGGPVMNEIHWLKYFKSGVAEIYDDDEKLNAVLMEHLVPGKPLKTLVQMGDDDGATRVICHLIRQMIRELQVKVEESEKRFKHLSELAYTLPLLRGHFDEKLLSKAESLFKVLTSDRKNDVLLHGDLHHDNILSSGPSWKVIDPHGYIGDPTMEVGTMTRNPYDCFPRDRPIVKVIERRLNILTEELPFDPQKIRAWAFCVTVLAASWSLEGHGKVHDLEKEVAFAVDAVSRRC